MDRHVNAIAGRLSLRPPQRRSLEILDRITEIVPPKKGADLEAALATIGNEFPTVTEFEREFPSLCFALATGVGKTRLMGAFISYLHLAHGLNNFFVLAPNLTIYNKLITDFTENTPKYVFKGISEFAVAPPVITTGENYERQIASGGSLFPTTVNIFNISKINSEVRGGRSPRIRSFREEIGESYFDYLASLDDLVLIMDESHRYRASAGIRAINELKPVLGLELTATPFVESTRGPVPFKNVIFDYPLGRAMADGFVKEPAVVTRENFVATVGNAQILAGFFGLSANPANTPGGTNYAIGSAFDDAALGPGNENLFDILSGQPNPSLPGTARQIQNYLASVNGYANPNVLYLVGSGGNDATIARLIFTTPAEANAFLLQEAGALVSSVAKLQAAGGRYIVVTNEYAPPLPMPPQSPMATHL